MNLQTQQVKRKTRNSDAQRNLWGWFFVFPFLLVYLTCHLYPIIYTIILSFSDMYKLKQNSDMGFAGFANYIRLFNDKYFWMSVLNTMVVWLGSYVPQLGIALLLSIWLSDRRLKLKGKGLFRAVMYMPNLMAAASVAILYQRLFSYPVGPINQFLQQYLGIYDSVLKDGVLVRQAFDFFRDPVAARSILVYIQWWMWVGYTIVLLMAGITGIPHSLYEAAVVDGARNWQLTWYITVPMLRPIMIYITVTSVIGGMQMFDVPFCLRGMGAAPDYIRTTSVYFYSVAFGGLNNYSYGSAVSIGMFFITLIMSLTLYFLMRGKEIR